MSASFDTGTGGNYKRALFQDAAGRATGTYGYAIYEDLTPEGQPLYTYVPKACTGATCGYGSSGTYPSAPTTPQLASESRFNGLSHVSETISYRCNTDTATRPSGCSSGTALKEVARQQEAWPAPRSTTSPIRWRASELAWRQSNDQYLQSLKDSAGANEDLYHTTYAYDERTRSIAATDNAYRPTATGSAPVSVTGSTVYDAEEHPIQVDDEFLANGGFENGLSGWNYSGASAHLVNSADAFTRTSASFGSAVTPANAYVRDEIQLVAGQTFRFAVSGRTDGTANALARLAVQY